MTFYDKKERDCIDKLQRWNSTAMVFDEITPTSSMTRHDAEATYKGQTWYIEMKDRDYNALTAFTFTDIFIEPSKLQYLLDCQNNGHPTAYINFFGDDMVVFYGCELQKALPNLNKTTVKIFDKGSRQYKEVERYHLPISLSKIITINDQGTDNRGNGRE